jgi:hypothetical protein
VRTGKLTADQFAADLGAVAAGAGATAEYTDPVEFFERTYLTAGIKNFLSTALKRLAGEGGDSVIQLKTGFGGGKTHTMLALYHLVRGGPELQKVDAVRELAAEAGVPLTRANVAVLVGTHIDATTAYQDDELKSLGLALNTLWGRMAWQLGGRKAYDLVQQADITGTAPGAETLSRLFREYSPAVVLIDELVAFGRNLPTARDRVPAGNLESNLTFVQNLTEAAKATPRTLVAASIPASDMEIGGQAGQRVLARIENTFGRIETPWTPVEATESFEVVRRRLFGSVDPGGRDQVVAAFARYYRDNASELPAEVRERAYEERMKSAYPFHPELFDRLYEDWSAARPNFQSTRGVLRLLAAAVQWLYRDGDTSPLIMPGTLPLNAAPVRDEFLRYIDSGFRAVIDGDVDGTSAESVTIDSGNPRFGKVNAARAVARTIFLGSPPGKSVAGIEDVRIRLGAARPGESMSTYNDALGRLGARLQFLHTTGSRYWFGLHPNLNKVHGDRMSRVGDDDVFNLLEERLKEDRDAAAFAGKHVAPASTADVPDDTAVRLVVISPRYPHAANAADSGAIRWATTLLETRGNAPRLNRNMLVFAALDEESLQGLVEQARGFLAWRSIVAEKGQINLDEGQEKQATEGRDGASRSVDALLRDGYRWALVPERQATLAGGTWTVGDETMVAVDTSRGLSSVGKLAEKTLTALQQDEKALAGWSQLSLQRELDRWFWPQGIDHVSVRKLWEENLTRYVYFPRPMTKDVLARAITDGAATRDFFGYAAGIVDGKYVGLKFGEKPGTVLFDSDAVLVRKDVAAAAQPTATAPAAPRGPGGVPGPAPGPEPPKAPVRPRRFYGSVKLNELRLSSAAGQIGDEVVQHLAGLMGAEVEVVLEVRAKVPDGIPEDVVRTVSENAATLKFQAFEFEDE